MQSYALLIVVGLLAGFASALLGIGGGVILVPALTFLFAAEWIACPAGFDPIKVATVTSLAYIVPVALAGAIRSTAPVKWTVVLCAVPAGIVGAYLGAWAKDRIPAAQLKMVFAVVMLIAGVRLGLNGWREWHHARRAAPPAPPAAGEAERPVTSEERPDAGS